MLRTVASFAACLGTSLILSLPAIAQDTPDAVVAGKEQFEMRVLTTGLLAPWEVALGPDGMLWVTERVGRKIDRIDPATGETTTLIEIAEASAPGGQDGLLGLALHPGFGTGTGNDQVFTAYTYVDKDRGQVGWVADPFSPYAFLYTKIVRLTYDAASNRLVDPVDLVAGLPAFNDHNSGRIKIGPDSKLYYTIGDGGKDQLGNWCIPIEAQRLPTDAELSENSFIAYQGKSLRLNLNGSIPEDNPEIEGVRSHVFTYGHRNMQGIDFAPDGTLYASEQGPKTDDEVNILVAGGNYGWPHVSGFRDDKAYQYARWADATTPCAQLQFSDIDIHPSVPVEDETSWTEDMVEPLATMFTVPSDWDFTDPACGGIDFICWPTVAASSMQTYFPEDGAGIPGWGNSLLVTTLKRGSLYRIPLGPDGQTVAGPMERFFQSENRFRDVALSPDMRTIYVATDSWGLAESLSGGTTTTMQNPGSILVFTWTGPDAEATGSTPDAGVAKPVAATAAGGAPLPQFTAAQVEDGRVAYAAHCVSCHGQNLVSATYGTPLAGPYFDGRWRGRSVAALYDHAHDRMPPSRPASLPDATYASLTAYVLSVNGLPAGEQPLPADRSALAEMTIPR